MNEHTLNSTTVKIIHKHIDRLCMKMNESPQEIEDFREEMTSNLKSGVKEWVSRGYMESDAVQKALEHFGETSEIEEELQKLYRIKKIFSGNILRAAIALLLVGVLIVGWFPIWNEILHYEVAKKAFDIVKQEMGTAEQPIREEMRNELKHTIANSISITGVVLRIQDDISKAPQGYPVAYHYPEVQKLDRLNNISFKENLFTYVTSSGTSIAIPGTGKAVSIDLGVKMFNNVTFMIGITMLFGYWILFAVWASMNVYYRGHGKALWVVSFLLFNVLGYGIYKVVVKLNKHKQRKWIPNYA